MDCPYDEDIFSLKTQDSWTWVTFSESLSRHIRENHDTLHHWTLSDADLRYLIGPHTPSALPLDQNYEWRPEDTITPLEVGTEGHATTSTHEE